MSDTPSLAQKTQSSTPAEMAEQEPTDQRSETCDETDENTDIDLGEGTSNAASESDPAPSANKQDHKPAFVKIMQLDEREMLTAYLEAFFGESLATGWTTSLMVVVSANRSLPLLRKVRWGPSRGHQRRHDRLP